MDWVNIAALGVIGGLSALIAQVVTKAQSNSDSAVEGEIASDSLAIPTAPKATNRWLFNIVFLISFLLLNSVYKAQIKPLNDARLFRNELLKIDAYAALSEKEPELFQRAITQATRDGLPKTASAVKDSLAGVWEATVTKYMRLASDEALVDYMEASMAVVTERRQQSGLACYLALFPAAATPADKPLLAMSTVTPKAQQDLFAAMAGLLRSSSTTPPASDLAVGEARFLGSIAPPLQDRYGSDLALLETADSAIGADRDKVCAMASDMYSAVLALQIGRASVLRFLLS